MRIALYIIFAAIAAFLCYLLWDSIQRPVDFKETYESRQEFIHDRLEELAELQELYKGLKGDSLYANSFDSMQHTFLNDSFFLTKIEGDPFDTTIVADTVQYMYPARDSLGMFIAEKGYIDVDSFVDMRAKAFKIMEDTTADQNHSDVKNYLAYVDKQIKAYMKERRKIPFAKDNKEFEIESGEKEMEARRSFGKKIPTFEIRVKIGDYMHEYPLDEYGMYNPLYDPKFVEKVGDLYKPINTGNW